MRFIVGIAGLICIGLICIGLFLLGDDKGIDEPVANVPQDIPMPIPIDQIRSKYLADDKQLNNVTKLEPATAVVRVGSDMEVPVPFDVSFTLPSDDGEVVNVGEDIAVGAVDYARYYTDEIQAVGEPLDVYAPKADGTIKQVVIDGLMMDVGASKSQVMPEPTVMVGNPLAVP